MQMADWKNEQRPSIVRVAPRSLWELTRQDKVLKIDLIDSTY